ncbi:hypothetical protein [Avibacterium paragallinarum]|nr:hypothetical protein [Avibacterium paragallinarum]
MDEPSRLSVRFGRDGLPAYIDRNRRCEGFLQEIAQRKNPKLPIQKRLR